MCAMAQSQCFYLGMEKPHGHYSKFGLLTNRRHSGTRKHLSVYPQGDRLDLGKPKKDKHKQITATTSFHLLKLAATDLIMKSDLVLINPIGKDGMQRDVIKHLPHKVFLS